MRARQRPGSQHGPPRQTRGGAPRPTRKIFNCIVDDSALVAGVKLGTRNGIRQWVKNAHIRLFVPLHALEELSRQKNNKSKHAEDVRETLQWLDEATTKHPNVVTLQGADETYERWAEVERFAVPRTLFSENNHEHELEPVYSDELAEETVAKPSLEDGNAQPSNSSGASEVSRSLSPSSLRSMHSSLSPVSPPTSPHKPTTSPIQNLSSLTSGGSRPVSSSGIVPLALQPLFNYILWRIHQESDPVAALESFIFLCNDPRKVTVAKGFDIKTKRLEQLREAVAREGRDYNDRLKLLNRENQDLNALAVKSTGDEAPAVEEDDDDDDDDEVVFKPPRALAAMLQKQQPNVIDPNAFGREPQLTKIDPQNGAPKSPRLNHAPMRRGSPRGNHAVPFTPRANTRGNFRGNARGRGGFGGRGGHTNNASQNAELTEIKAPNGQIDPDSFARPDPRVSGIGARGGRKLWVPT